MHTLTDEFGPAAHEVLPGIKITEMGPKVGAMAMDVSAQDFSLVFALKPAKNCC